MSDKKGKAFLVFILIILIIVFAFLTYLLYQYLPGEPQEFSAFIKKPELEIGNLSYKVKQFHPNMKFNHNSISYKIDSECSEQKRERMISAFNELATKVEVISFYPIDSEFDIEIRCSEKPENLVREDFFIAGEGGAKEIIQTERYNVITSGLILLFSTPHKAVECDWSNVELHELLHVFGFEHSQDENSLMYSYLESCSQRLDESIIQDLKELYSKENLADLYFEKVEAVKRGRYLDFNVTVKNSGVIDAKGVILTVFDNNEEVEGFNLKSIPFGGGITFQVANLRLMSRNSKNIEIIIDYGNSIEEIDEENNVVKLEFV